jgi:hypothetical protein
LPRSIIGGKFRAQQATMAGAEPMTTHRTQGHAFAVLRPSARRLLLFIETEIARGGSRTIKLYDDQFTIIGSRRVVGPGICELHALGLIDHVRGVKCGTFAVSQRWRGIRTPLDAITISARAREIGRVNIARVKVIGREDAHV